MPQGSPSLETQIALLGRQLEELRHELADQRTLISGPPWDRSLRGRVHQLWDERNASRLATEALAEAQHERRRAQSDRERSESARHGSLRWRIATAIATAAAIYPYLAHAAHWH